MIAGHPDVRAHAARDRFGSGRSRSIPAGVDRVIPRVLALAVVAIVIVVALREVGPVRRTLVVAGRRVATAVDWYHATEAMSLTIEPHCTSVTVQAWGQPWIGPAPSALAAGSGGPSVIQDPGVLTRTSYSSATFADGGGVSVVLRRTVPQHLPETSCGAGQRT